MTSSQPPTQPCCRSIYRAYYVVQVIKGSDVPSPSAVIQDAENVNPGVFLLVDARKGMGPVKLHTRFLCATHICIARPCCRKMAGWMSHAGIVSKSLKISSNFFSLGLVVPPPWFSYTALRLRNSNGNGSLSLGWTFWQCCTTVRPADILTPSAYYTAANQLPILFLPPDDIASRRFHSIS